MKLIVTPLFLLFSLSVFASDIQSMTCPFKKLKVDISLDITAKPKSKVLLVDESKDYRNPTKTPVKSTVSRNGSGYEVSFPFEGAKATVSFDLIIDGLRGVTDAKINFKNKNSKVLCNASRNYEQIVTF